MQPVHVAQASRITGVPYATLQYWIRTDKIRSARIGGVRYVNMNDIKRALDTYIPGKRGLRKGQKLT